ncbi:hypothetical protein SAMN02787144_1002436 [Streptomyces atratus]|uniref:Uncharacterized protein n=1 Tax=Streptomyces atratus TaxID=1893 RepID=A0A1K1WFH2_STRAR|nr:hypothetical protein SAMN02787144_1002436 [Streptomyces atratus]
MIASSAARGSSLATQNPPGRFRWARRSRRIRRYSSLPSATAPSCPVSGLTGAALLSNGASRIVDRFRLVDWPGAMALLASSGPAEIVHRVRQAEARHAVAADDATVAHCTGLGTI